MPNNCLSLLYKHIIQVENKNVGLKVKGGGGINIPLPPNKKVPPAPPPPPQLPSPVIIKRCKMWARTFFYVITRVTLCLVSLVIVYCSLHAYSYTKFKQVEWA